MAASAQDHDIKIGCVLRHWADCSSPVSAVTVPEGPMPPEVPCRYRSGATATEPSLSE